MGHAKRKVAQQAAVRRGGRRAAGGGAKRPTQWDAPRKKSRAVSVRTSAKEETAKSAGAPAHAHPPGSHPKCAPGSEDAGVGVGACVRGCACARVVGRCGIDPHTSRPRAPEHPPHMIAPSHTRPCHARTPNARWVSRCVGAGAGGWVRGSTFTRGRVTEGCRPSNVTPSRP